MYAYWKAAQPEPASPVNPLRLKFSDEYDAVVQQEIDDIIAWWVTVSYLLIGKSCHGPLLAKDGRSKSK